MLWLPSNQKYSRLSTVYICHETEEKSQMMRCVKLASTSLFNNWNHLGKPTMMHCLYLSWNWFNKPQSSIRDDGLKINILVTKSRDGVFKPLPNVHSYCSQLDKKLTLFLLFVILFALFNSFWWNILYNNTMTKGYTNLVTETCRNQENSHIQNLQMRVDQIENLQRSSNCQQISSFGIILFCMVK